MGESSVGAEWTTVRKGTRNVEVSVDLIEWRLAASKPGSLHCAGPRSETERRRKRGRSGRDDNEGTLREIAVTMGIVATKDEWCRARMIMECREAYLVCGKENRRAA